jgi:hypothetical protein
MWKGKKVIRTQTQPWDKEMETWTKEQRMKKQITKIKVNHDVITQISQSV